jgi:hypothetical protein
MTDVPVPAQRSGVTKPSRFTLEGATMRVLHTVGHALAISGTMTWQILWALILGFGKLHPALARTTQDVSLRPHNHVATVSDRVAARPTKRTPLDRWCSLPVTVGGSDAATSSAGFAHWRKAHPPVPLGRGADRGWVEDR